MKREMLLEMISILPILKKFNRTKVEDMREFPANLNVFENNSEIIQEFGGSCGSSCSSSCGSSCSFHKKRM